uniref:Mannosyltransferase n=1 Tax=Trichobilharzia regenti TaxID=157069 RepID=A0AA85J1R6_TRIRE
VSLIFKAAAMNRLLILFSVVVTTLVFICPFTKVEESFNIQALHDLLYFGSNLTSYDHKEFPGVVPRSFLGSLLISWVCAPVVYLCSLLKLNKFVSQYIVRISLGVLTILSLKTFANSVKKVFGKHVCARFLVICCSQFHFSFYASRTLPNSFANILVLYSLGQLINGNQAAFLVSAGVSVLVFRSELILLFGPCLLYALFTGRVSIGWNFFKIIITTTIISIGCSVLIDSYFWGRLIWPELEVFYFNTILNKSGQWGTYPFHWYFTSALPRSLLCSCFILYAWIPIIMVRILRKLSTYKDDIIIPQSTGLLFVALIFIGLYSFLPHKELRFIIYVLPVLNLVVADIWTNLEKPVLSSKGGDVLYMNLWKKKSLPKRITVIRLLLISCCYTHLLVNAACSLVLTKAAQNNYPGGEALNTLNHMEHLTHRN